MQSFKYPLLFFYLLSISPVLQPHDILNTNLNDKPQANIFYFFFFWNDIRISTWSCLPLGDKNHTEQCLSYIFIILSPDNGFVIKSDKNGQKSRVTPRDNLISQLIYIVFAYAKPSFCFPIHTRVNMFSANMFSGSSSKPIVQARTFNQVCPNECGKPDGRVIICRNTAACRSVRTTCEGAVRSDPSRSLIRPFFFLF